MFKSTTFSSSKFFAQERDSLNKLNEIKSEIEDRFGKISDSMEIYMYEEWFENMASKLNISEVKQTKDNVEITLDKNLTSKINGETLFLESLKISSEFSFKMFAGNLIISLNTKQLDKHFVYYLNDLLSVIIKDIKK